MPPVRNRGPASTQPASSTSPGTAAERSGRSQPAPGDGFGSSLTGYRWSANVLAEVVAAYGLSSPSRLLRAASELDDGNKYLKRSELMNAAQRIQSFALRGYRWSPNVLLAVMTGSNLSDERALLREAVHHDDGNRYLKRSEFEAAAKVLAGGGLSGYRYSAGVAAAVMAAHGITDINRLIREATKHDSDSNRYLKRSELEAAAVALNGGAPEVGYISDLDKTIIPPHSNTLPAQPYPGVRALLRELEFGGSGLPGDAYYVTARTPARMTGVAEWMDSKGLPPGEIETGVSGVPWLAEKEKVKDLSAILDAKPGQNFVLFGDSSHRDPEVFKRIVAKYPGRIIAAFVHKVNNVSPSRVSGLELIENYAQAGARLLARGRLDEAAARRVMTAAQLEGLNITDAEIDALIASHQPA